MDLWGVLVVEDRVGEGSDGWSVPAAEHVANRPIARHALDALQAAGARRVVVASSVRSAGIVRECLSDGSGSDQPELEFVEQAAPLGFASALHLVAPVINRAPCLVHSAGGLLAEPLAPVARCLHDAPDAVLMVHHAAPPDQRLSSAAQHLLHLAELDPKRSALGMAGVWGFGPGALSSAASAGMELQGIASIGQSAPIGPSPVDLAALAERITFAGGTLQVRLVDVWRAYRGKADELLELNRFVLDQIKSDPPHGDEDGNRIEGRVRIHESASVRASMIVGPVVIGAGAQISDAYIGPYTAIGSGAVIQGAEIERSIILAGASVTHVGGRITASIVGRNARLFRDFSLPRAFRVNIGDGAEVGLC
jgi:glucose-1-phosphate thymidylyltransferase